MAYIHYIHFYHIKQKKCALHVACKKQRLGQVHLLLSYGANINIRDEVMPLR